MTPRRIILAGQLTAAALIAVLAFTAPAFGTGTTPKTCDGQTVKQHVQRGKEIIRKGFAHKNWRSDQWNRKKAKRLMRHRNCIQKSAMHRFRLFEYKAQKREAWKKWSKRQKKKAQAKPSGWCSTQPHPDGAGCWTIPAYVVSCESGGSWSSYNSSSGAKGVYQFVGWPVPWPVDSYEDAQAHHEMARKLWAGGSGAGHWTACL